MNQKFILDVIFLYLFHTASKIHDTFCIEKGNTYQSRPAIEGPVKLVYPIPNGTPKVALVSVFSTNPGFRLVVSIPSAFARCSAIIISPWESDVTHWENDDGDGMSNSTFLPVLGSITAILFRVCCANEDHDLHQRPCQMVNLVGLYHIF